MSHFIICLFALSSFIVLSHGAAPVEVILTGSFGTEDCSGQPTIQAVDNGPLQLTVTGFCYFSLLNDGVDITRSSKITYASGTDIVSTSLFTSNNCSGAPHAVSQRLLAADGCAPFGLVTTYRKEIVTTISPDSFIGIAIWGYNLIPTADETTCYPDIRDSTATIFNNTIMFAGGASHMLVGSCLRLDVLDSFRVQSSSSVTRHVTSDCSGSGSVLTSCVPNPAFNQSAYFGDVGAFSTPTDAPTDMPTGSPTTPNPTALSTATSLTGGGMLVNFMLMLINNNT